MSFSWDAAGALSGAIAVHGEVAGWGKHISQPCQHTKQNQKRVLPGLDEPAQAYIFRRWMQYSKPEMANSTFLQTTVVTLDRASNDAGHVVVDKAVMIIVCMLLKDAVRLLLGWCVLA